MDFGSVELRVQKKIVLNKDYQDQIEVAIVEMECVRKGDNEEFHYILSFGGDKTIRIIGEEDWLKFKTMLQWIDWNAEDTHEIFFAKEDLESPPTKEKETFPIHILNSKTEEYDFYSIIEGAPIYD